MSDVQYVKPTSTIQILEGSAITTPIHRENPHIAGVWGEEAPDYILCPTDAKIIWPIVLEPKHVTLAVKGSADWELEGGTVVVRTHFPIDHPAAFMLVAQNPADNVYHFFDVEGFMLHFYDAVLPEVWDLLGLKVDPGEAFGDKKDRQLKEGWKDAQNPIQPKQ